MAAVVTAAVVTAAVIAGVMVVRISVVAAIAVGILAAVRTSVAVPTWVVGATSVGDWRASAIVLSPSAT
jgi:hypothetical protein